MEYLLIQSVHNQPERNQMAGKQDRQRKSGGKAKSKTGDEPDWVNSQRAADIASHLIREKGKNPPDSKAKKK